MRPNIHNLRGLADASDPFRWQLKIVRFPLALPASVSSDDIDWRCLSTDVPKYEAAAMAEAMIRGHALRRPQNIVSSASGFTLTFLDTEDNRIHNFLAGLRTITFDPETGKSKPHREINMDMSLLRLDRDDNPIWEYKLQGAYYMDAEFVPGGLTGTGGSFIQPTLTLGWDLMKDGPLG